MGFWTDRPVFVTGATGLLGSHLTRELVERGADVTCLVRDSVARSHFHKLGLDEKVSVVRGQLEDYALLERALNEYEIESVFHLGAQTIVGTANRNPLATFEANVRGTYNLMEAARRNGKRVKRVVVASSDKAYGAQPKLPYDENSPLEGRFPYDCSKSCTDLITQSYYAAFQVPACVTRCGNLYGAGDLNWNRLVPGTIRSALRGERPLIRSDGTFVRDYFYVEDAVAAYLELAENMDRPEIVGQAFNFSDDKPLSVVQMVDRILEACGRKDLEPIIQGEASNEIPEQFLSSAKANRLLGGWKPRFGMKDALPRAVAWYKELLSAS
ncbi:MAG TPA: NAD-dependent epimerase/dehydratase family protein [Kofleriaceae bacterium]|nr:NAD-dependent epimerase/dehydratase family protein [Kofleriaceae bacterium]